MTDIVLKSSLTEEEVKENFKNADLFSGLMSGLNEALAYEKGSPVSEVKVKKRSLPDIDTTEIRRKLQMSKKEFASLLGVSEKTVESWESGKTNPSNVAVNLLYLISMDYTLVSKLQART